MRVIKGLWLFYQKLIIPSLAISLVLSLFAAGFAPIYVAMGFGYAVLTPFIHLYTYEVNSPNEYYFYHNLGLSKITLWAHTLGISLLLCLILVLL
jgi:hypothetical protein